MTTAEEFNRAIDHLRDEDWSKRDADNPSEQECEDDGRRLTRKNELIAKLEARLAELEVRATEQAIQSVEPDTPHSCSYGDR